MTGGLALFAFRRGTDVEPTEAELLGAMLEHEYQSVMLKYVEAWFEVHKKRPKKKT